MKLLIGLTLFMIAALAQAAGSEILEMKIRLIAPHAKNVSEIANAVAECQVKDDLVLAVIKIESDFKIDAVNNRSNDYGLMQVNEYHVKKKKLNRVSLLIDVKYNIKEGCKILNWFVNSYKGDESIARYNCGTGRRCVRILSVKNYVRKVKKIVDRLQRFDEDNLMSGIYEVAK